MSKRRLRHAYSARQKPSPCQRDASKFGCHPTDDRSVQISHRSAVKPTGRLPGLQVAKKELAMECDYSYEARCQSRFKVLVESDPEFTAVFHVPAVVPELSTERVLTTELVHGVHIDQVCCPLPDDVYPVL